MEELNLEDLKQEASELGIEFSDRIGAKTLKERIDTYYSKESEDSVVEVKEEVLSKTEKGPLVGVQPSMAELLKMDNDKIKEVLADDPQYMHTVIMRKIDIEARKTRVVKITMVDKREASTATDAYFSNGTMALRVPLDTFVEMPNALIEQAEAAITSVKDEVRSKGVQGLVLKDVKKYVIEEKK